MKKIPEIAVAFWVMKIYATTLGETTGTTMSDFMDRTLALGYMGGSLILVGILTTIFTVWHLSEKTLCVHTDTVRQKNRPNRL